MAEKQHTTGKSSERPKVIKRRASSKGVKRYAAETVEGRAQKPISRAKSFKPSVIPGNLGRLQEGRACGQLHRGQELFKYLETGKAARRSSLPLERP